MSEASHCAAVRAAASALIALLAVPAVAGAATERTERVVRTPAPDARAVKESHVRLHAPMPESSPEHAEACDWISYLRFRHRSGPRRSSRADAVLTMMPGIFAGGGSFDQVARHTIRRAAKRGRHVEVWGIERRSNCLEDHRGVRAGAKTGDPRVSFGYYFEGREVDGHTFPGFADEQEAAFLRDVGLKRTIEDWHTIITREIPSQRKRQRKLICGGHSLGGPLTAALASWDFDGDPETTADAGYNQCAAFVGLDTTVSLDGGDGGGGAALLTDAAAQSGASPYVNAPPLTPETLLAPALIGVTAFQRPNEETIVTQLIPRDPEWELTQRLLFSRNAQDFVTGSPSVRDFRVTNAAALAAIFDDNSSPISIFRASIGMYTGGPLVDKSFPAPDPTLAAPEEPHGPLYEWQNFSRVGANGAPLELNDEGEPYTVRDSEVTNVRQLGRALYQFPANFIETYFPTRLVTDFAAMESGDRSGDLENLRHDGPSMKPILLVQAGDSDSNDNEDSGPTETGEKPNDKELSREAILPGYNHLDVATAAWRQNDGRPEGSSRELVRFLLKVTPR